MVSWNSLKMLTGKQSSTKPHIFKLFLFLCASLIGIYFIFSLLTNSNNDENNLMDSVNNDKSKIFNQTQNESLISGVSEQKNATEVPVFKNDKSKRHRKNFTRAVSVKPKYHKQQNKSMIVYNETTEISDTLFKSVKILCLINTAERRIEKHAIPVNETWAKRCNKYLFLSYSENVSLPYINLKRLPEGKQSLWNKIRKVIRWVLMNEFDGYDFFLMADDESYFVMENLRYMLLPYNPSKSLYFGGRFKPTIKNGTISDGTGFILSREAVIRLARSFYDSNICPQKMNDEEDIITRLLQACAEKLSIEYVDTIDNQGRNRMIAIPPSASLKSVENETISLCCDNQVSEELNCCTDYYISFHRVSPNLMFTIEHSIYMNKYNEFINNFLIQPLKDYTETVDPRVKAMIRMKDF